MRDFCVGIGVVFWIDGKSSGAAFKAQTCKIRADKKTADATRPPLAN
jgi:hypothetical protein